MSAGRVQDVHPPVDLVEESKLNKARHVKYWLRCLKTYLPVHYQGNDSNRMMLAYFIISAMDLLDCLTTSTTPEEREDYIKWVYHCQHPNGGFRGFPGTDFGEHSSEKNGVWDPANTPATFFALAILAILGDDFSRVKRKECLQWLRRVQRLDGSFGETVGADGKVEGGMDSRFGYTAMGVRWILRGKVKGDVLGVPDISVDKLVHRIRISQTYDGGISDAPFHEAHGGFTYCAISALSFVDYLPSDSPPPEKAGLTDLDLTVHWLISRQTATLDEEDILDTYGDETDTTATCHDAHSFVALPPTGNSKRGEDSLSDRPTSNYHLNWIGFNGRCNKIADTCYSWWISASLEILKSLPLSTIKSNRRYLLEQTQHSIGGFGKKVGDPPDIYHSYLGLAALSLCGEKDLKAIDATVCFSVDACRHLESLPWRQST